MHRGIFIIVVFIHGLIHLIGFVKAFDLADLKELTGPISKQEGTLWIIAFFLFLSTGILYTIKNNYWWCFGLAAVILSQILVINFWQDAKFGTIFNFIILLVTIVGFGSWNFESSYKRDVAEGFKHTSTLKNELVSIDDLKHLPPAIKKYLNYVGVVGKPKVRNVKITMKGEMRGKEQAWFNFKSEQYNFFDEPARLFFMKAKVKSLPTQGYHVFKKAKASIVIKLLSLFPVVDVRGKEMDEAEAVTFFNEMCLFAPAVLIDKNIQWEAINDFSVKATFPIKDIQISAILYFNKKGQLIDFQSDDRYDISDMKKYRFSTPARNYKNMNGYILCTYGEAIWHYPKEKFVYGKFWIEKLEINLMSGNETQTNTYN